MKWLFKQEFNWLEVIGISFAVQMPWNTFWHFAEAFVIVLVVCAISVIGRKHYHLND